MNASPRVVAECGACALVEDGPRLALVNRGTGAGYVLALLLGGFALIVGTSALSALAGAVAGEDPVLAVIGVVLGGLAVVAGAGFAVAVVSIRKAHARLPTSFVPIVVIDRSVAVLRAGSTGQPIAPLRRVWFESRSSLASSQRELAVCWKGGGRIPIVRYHALAGLRGLDGALRARGFAVNG